MFARKENPMNEPEERRTELRPMITSTHVTKKLFGFTVYESEVVHDDGKPEPTEAKALAETRDAHETSDYENPDDIGN